MEETIENILTCAVCLGRLNDPRLLPCQHTFCLQPCLRNIFDRTSMRLQCPLCRYVMNRIHDPALLPVNRTVKSLIEVQTYNHSQSDQNDGSMSGNGNTISRQLHNGDGNVRPPRTCSACQRPDSQDPLCDNPCPHCRLPVCHTCYKKHYLELYSGLQSQVMNRMQRVSTYITSLQEQTTVHKNQLAHSWQNTKLDIVTTFARIKASLEAREEMLLTQLEVAHAAAQEQLLVLEEQLQGHAVELDSMQQHLTSTLDTLPTSHTNVTTESFATLVELRDNAMPFVQSQETFVAGRNQQPVDITAIDCPQFECSEQTVHTIIHGLGSLSLPAGFGAEGEGPHSSSSSENEPPRYSQAIPRHPAVYRQQPLRSRDMPQQVSRLPALPRRASLTTSNNAGGASNPNNIGSHPIWRMQNQLSHPEGLRYGSEFVSPREYANRTTTNPGELLAMRANGRFAFDRQRVAPQPGHRTPSPSTDNHDWFSSIALTLPNQMDLAATISTEFPNHEQRTTIERRPLSDTQSHTAPSPPIRYPRRNPQPHSEEQSEDVIVSWSNPRFVANRQHRFQRRNENASSTDNTNNTNVTPGGDTTGTAPSRRNPLQRRRVTGNAGQNTRQVSRDHPPPRGPTSSAAAAEPAPTNEEHATSTSEVDPVRREGTFSLNRLPKPVVFDVDLKNSPPQ